MQGKITEDIIKDAFKATIEANVDRLYEDFKLRFMAAVSPNATAASRTLIAPASKPAASRNYERRTHNTHKGFVQLYKDFMAGTFTKRWTRSEQSYVCQAFATDIPWKKGIQYILALDSLRTRYDTPSKKPYVLPYKHNILRMAIADIIKLLDKLKESTEETASELNEELDNAGINFIDAVITYNNDCKTVDPSWPTRYSPGFPGRELFAIARNGGENMNLAFLSDENTAEESARINNRSGRNLSRLGL